MPTAFGTVDRNLKRVLLVIQGIFISYGSACVSSTWATGADPINQDLCVTSGRLSGEFRWIKESRFSVREMTFYSTASRATCLQTSASSLVLRIHPMQYHAWHNFRMAGANSNINCSKYFFRADSKDSQYSFHRSFLRAAYHYIDLRNAIKHENGDHIIRLWKFWPLYFLGSGCKNYATEAANLICNLQAAFPKAIHCFCCTTQQDR